MTTNRPGFSPVRRSGPIPRAPLSSVGISSIGPCQPYFTLINGKNLRVRAYFGNQHRRQCCHRSSLLVLRCCCGLGDRAMSPVLGAIADAFSPPKALDRRVSAPSWWPPALLDRQARYPAIIPSARTAVALSASVVQFATVFNNA